MNTLLISSLRAVALASALLLVPAITSAKDASQTDSTAQLLATAGIVPVKAAGPYVQVGSYRIHVSVRLGKPSAVLADGTWLYKGFVADESAAAGTLVIRFDEGRVSQLSLVSPTVATAMMAAPVNVAAKTLVASR